MAMDEKYLFYDSQAAGDEHESLFGGNPMWLWNDRLLLVKHIDDDERWHFTALDLITNETRLVHFSKSDSEFHQVKVVTLNNDYGFVVESGNDSFRVNLVKLNWAPGEFQLVERLDQKHRFSAILVSNLNPTKFVLKQRNDETFIYQACTLDSGKIEFGNTYECETFLEHYFDNKLYVVDYGVDEEEFIILTYDWTTKKEDSVKINALPTGRADLYRIEWIRKRLYTVAYFNDTATYKIAYIDFETLNWNFLDLVTDLRISKMQYFGGNLLVYATDNIDENDIDEGNFFGHGLNIAPYCSKFKIYSVPVRHPQSLRKMAWPLVVQALKRDESITDPYQAAAQFLPFNSDLRSPWYKDETALEVLDESESNVKSTEETAGKTSKGTLSQESSDAVPPKRSKFN